MLSLLLVGPVSADTPPSLPLTDAAALDLPAATPPAATAVTSAVPYVAGPGVRQGIDVSIWQGYVDWPRVARAGIDFTVAKATEGTSVVNPGTRATRPAPAVPASCSPPITTRARDGVA